MLNERAPGGGVERQVVLLLDDESNVRRLFSRWLGEAGYDCLEARDAQEARDALAARDVALLTLDVRMPGESGLDLVHQVRARHPDTAILLVTGCDDPRAAIAAYERGAAGFLIKPVDRELLLAHVRNALERRRQEIERREYVQQLEARLDRQERRAGRPHGVLACENRLLAGVEG